MNILIINGSPKGKYSITLQTLAYIKKNFPEHKYAVIQAGTQENYIENNFAKTASLLDKADLMIFSYPVYTFLVPSQLHRFIELLIKKNDEGIINLKGKFVTQVTTSKHFYDTTAHRFIEDNCADLDMKYIRGFSADMDDLTSDRGRRDAISFFSYVQHKIENFPMKNSNSMNIITSINSELTQAVKNGKHLSKACAQVLKDGVSTSQGLMKENEGAKHSPKDLAREVWNGMHSPKDLAQEVWNGMHSPKDLAQEVWNGMHSPKDLAREVKNGLYSPKELAQKVKDRVHSVGDVESEEVNRYSYESLKDAVIVADLAPEDNELKEMITEFLSYSNFEAKLINIHDFPFRGGCISCFNCSTDGTCIYKDGFQELLRDEIQAGKAIVLAFTIKNHSMGSVFKTYDDRQFCNGHRTVTMGMPFGYLINGNLSAEENLRTVIEARAQVGGNYLAGVATNERDMKESIRELAEDLAWCIDNKYTQPANFYGVGGMKIFRDLIFEMQGMMRADYKFFKDNGQMDFPQNHRGKIAVMYLVGALMSNEKLKSKRGNEMKKAMLAPYRKYIR